jgi:hypothetical protein
MKHLQDLIQRFLRRILEPISDANDRGAVSERRDLHRFNDICGSDYVDLRNNEGMTKSE